MHILISNTKSKMMKDSDLKRNTSLKGKEFSSSFVWNDTSSTSGTKTLEEFNAFNQQQEKDLMLREKGLTDLEIILKNKIDQGVLDENKLSFLEKGQYLEIKRKLLAHQITLQQPERFSTSVELSRREYEVDNATFHSSSSGTSKNKSNYFIRRKTNYLPDNHPLIETLREYDEKERSSKLRKSYQIEEEEEEEEGDENEDEEDDVIELREKHDKLHDGGQVEDQMKDEGEKGNDNDEMSFIGPLQLPINRRVQPIPEQLIFKHRLELGQILDMEKFKTYKAGKPNKVLYIKNLHKDVLTVDLARLFCRYCADDELDDVTYKLMQSGRMKGQAFVTFKDEETATRALLLCNGYKLYGQPIIIQYGRAKS